MFLVILTYIITFFSHLTYLYFVFLLVTIYQILGFMKWINDYKILRDDIHANEDELRIYKGRIDFVQNCIDCSLHDRSHILLNELWRNKSADIHASHLRHKKHNSTKSGNPSHGEEGDDEARQERNEYKEMSRLIEDLRTKFGNLEGKEFHGDQERVEAIKDIYQSQNIIKSENLKYCVAKTKVNVASQEYEKLKNYDIIKIQNVINIENSEKNKKKNNTQLEGIYIYVYV